MNAGPNTAFADKPGKPDSIFDYKFEDFEISGYDPYPHIKAPVAI